MKAMVLFSGGVDSTTCLALAIQKYGSENVLALTIRYGQKHNKEIKSARKILSYYHIEGMEMDLTDIFKTSDCSLLSHSKDEIPMESYAEQIKNSAEKPVTTYVPFRNGLFLSTAASIALSRDVREIYYGAHKDDAAGNAYPDCSNVFFQAMSQAIYEGSGQALTLVAPFITANKGEVVKIGLALQVPYELTWSCYVGLEKPCGICGTCIDRINAFKLNSVKDPILYK